MASVLVLLLVLGWVVHCFVNALTWSCPQPSTFLKRPQAAHCPCGNTGPPPRVVSGQTTEPNLLHQNLPSISRGEKNLSGPRRSQADLCGPKRYDPPSKSLPRLEHAHDQSRSNASAGVSFSWEKAGARPEGLRASVILVTNFFRTHYAGLPGIIRDYAGRGQFSSRLIPLKVPLNPVSDRLTPPRRSFRQ